MSENKSLGSQPLTEKEMKDIHDLPRMQPGCSAPNCYSCETNHRRTNALMHLIERVKYLEAEQSEKTTLWNIWRESDDIGRSPAKLIAENIAAPTFREACRRRFGASDAYNATANTYMGLRLFYCEVEAAAAKVDGPASE